MPYTVTKKHIADGVRYSSHLDPVALCLAEAFKTTEVYVDQTLIGIKGKCVKTPPEVADFIRAFDRRESVNELSFELEITK